MIRRNWWDRYQLLVVLLALLVYAVASPALAQSRRSSKPVHETVGTKDGVQLKLTYFPSKRENLREATPVICLHEWKGNRHSYDDFARWLQQTKEEGDVSHAVIVPDLRGHGDSTRAVLPNGREVELDAARLRRNDFEAMIVQDMEAVRRFLVEKNNAGELNLNKLVIVGAEMGATIAVNWAATDWSAPPLATGKQGQDVKGLVLISPSWSFKGVPMVQALKQPGIQRKVSALVLFGSRDNRQRRESERIFNMLSKDRPEFAPEEWEEKQEVFIQDRDTALQGIKLVGAQGNISVDLAIREFIRLRIDSQDFEWSDRSRD